MGDSGTVVMESTVHAATIGSISPVSSTCTSTSTGPFETAIFLCAVCSGPEILLRCHETKATYDALMMRRARHLLATAHH
eukprot:SAG25_NODE_395_length_8553_cov_4.407263_7_plen_80_part_00